MIRSRKVFNVLEFGLGFSTIVMADALRKNREEWLDQSPPPIDIRIREPFRIHSVDASEYWIEVFDKKWGGGGVFPDFSTINISHSKCEIGEYNGQICSFYSDVPNVVADLIYLDGPSANDVEGAIRGISFMNCPERTIISGNLLNMEACFLPGTLIVVDGRTNNARFLQNNFKRNWQVSFSEKDGVSMFELVEPPLGRINRAQLEYCLGDGYFERVKGW